MYFVDNFLLAWTIHVVGGLVSYSMCSSLQVANPTESQPYGSNKIHTQMAKFSFFGLSIDDASQRLAFTAFDHCLHNFTKSHPNWVKAYDITFFRSIQGACNRVSSNHRQWTFEVISWNKKQRPKNNLNKDEVPSRKTLGWSVYLEPFTILTRSMVPKVKNLKVES